jgi:HEAT repeat protein
LWFLKLLVTHDAVQLRSLILQDSLDHPDLEVRRLGLAVFRAPHLSGITLAEACDHRNTSVRIAALNGLVELNTDVPLDLISRFAADTDPAMRCGAARAFGQLEASAGTALLRPLLDDHEAAVSLEAAIALNAYGDPAALAALYRFCDHPDPSIQRRALSALHPPSENLDVSDTEPGN